jgi:hypothetical protein
MFGFWCWLIARANTAPKKWLYRGHLYELDRGQCLISIHDTAELHKISHKTLGRYLDVLETEQQITQKRDKRGTVITILNYSAYQGVPEFRGTTEGQQSGQERDNLVPDNVQDSPSNKNNKNNTKTGETDPSLHPSPNAPKHLNRKSQELKPYPHEDGPVYLTDDEYEALKERWSEAETKYVIYLVARWADDNPKKFRQRIDHARVCLTFRDRAIGDGKLFFDHPETGPNYYKRYEVERWQQHQ